MEQDRVTSTAADRPAVGPSRWPGRAETGEPPPEGQLRSLIDRLPAIVYTAELGINGRWRFVSPQIEVILGYTPEEWLAEPEMWSRHVHRDDREYAFSFESEEWLGMPTAPPAEYRMVTRDGRVVWVLEEAKLVSDAGGVPVWHGVMYDITHRKQVERNMRALADQQAAIAELGRRGLEGDDPERLIDATFEFLLGEEQIDLVAIWEHGAGRGPLRLRKARRRGLALPARGIVAGPDSHVGAAAAAGRAVTVEDWDTTAEFVPPPLVGVEAIRSSAAVVIEGKDRPFGVLDVHSSAAGAFTDQEVAFLRATANVLATAIDRRRIDDELLHRAFHDHLTGLPNRRRFVEVLDRALGRSREMVAVLFLDLDNFKLINDGIGHHAGDELLRTVAPRLAGRLRPRDTIARFGGDEFAIVLEGIESEREAIEVARRIEAELTRPVEIGGVANYVTASIGIALAPPGDDRADAETLVRDADAAMYAAKARGRAGHAVFDDAMRETTMQRLETLRDMRVAVERGELRLHYQPIVSLADCRIEGFEALVRWQHPRRGLLLPADFIPTAEDTDLIESIGSWVIEEACRQFAEWTAEHPDAAELGISVNVAARQLTHHDLCGAVGEILERTGLDPGRLRLEITEGVLLDEPEPIGATLEELSHLGVRIVLDDFGTGYSSLAYLDRFHLDALKVDRSFASRLERGERGLVIVEAIVAMARALSLVVIAEGVETGIQAERLARLGCDQGQGYLYSRPVPAGEAGKLLSRGRLEPEAGLRSVAS